MKENYIRFGIYKHNLVIEPESNKHLQISRNFIVLKDNYNNIIAWTNFHHYIKGGKYKKVKHISDDGINRFYYVVKFLNYCFFEKYNINYLKEINVKILKDFFNDYGLCKLENDSKTRQKKTVELCINYIIDFIECLIDDKEIGMKIKKDDLYKEVPITTHNMNYYRKSIERKKVPAFDVLYIERDSEDIFRDMPNGVFEIYMNQIIKKHPRLIMLVALSSFAGIRPSEACNVFMEDSPICKGLIISYENGNAYNIKIDLNEERVMRSDLIRVGKIKKERFAYVFPAFIDSFMSCYRIYQEYLEGKPYEVDYAPLTLNTQGKAMTYDSYYKEFKIVTKECIPILLSSDDLDLVNYGYMLLENRISPHIFRHWFSVQLTIMGCEVQELQFYRGDKDPNSSLVYLKNKGELLKRFKKVENEIFDYQYWKANKIYNS